MKFIKTILLLIVLVCCNTIYAQTNNGINYKAIIKDDNGNVVANQEIYVKFKILYGQGLDEAYIEEHSITTDNNGLIVLNIGEGSNIDGDYDDITELEWNTYIHYLNVSIDLDTGSGYIDLGTTEFKSVPYAMQAKNANSAITAEIAENVTGLEAIDDGNGIGWRFKGNTGSGNIGPGSVELSNSTSTASGGISLVGGILNTASGDGSVVFGSANQATAIRSTAFGEGNIASGNNATVFGTQTNANSYSSFTVGRGNIGGGDTVNWVETDPLFEIGNGESNSDRSNALTVLKNGTITAPSFDLSQITDNKALITKEYADTNLVSSGLEALDEGNGIGWRLKGKDPLNYTDIGLNAVDLSYSNFASSTFGASGFSATAMGSGTIASGSYSTALGLNTTASDFHSTAMGSGTTASGFNSTAMGAGSTASGIYSTAMGNTTTASGESSITMGVGTFASGSFSTALGYYTDALGQSSTSIGFNTLASGQASISMGFFNTARSYCELAIGSYNTDYTAIGPTFWNANDRLLVIGNGTSTSNRRDALTILKNGKLYVTPIHDDAELNDASGYLIIGEESGANIVFDNNEMMARNNELTSPLYFQRDGGNVSIGNVGTPNATLDVGGSIQYTGTITDVSDRRLKENFKSINDALERIEKIEGYSYNMINDEEKKREYGVMAQNVQKVFPEMVSTIDSEKEYLGVSYIQLIPVLIEAIKEQQVIIDKQNNKISELESLDSRVEQLEALLKKAKK